MPRAEGWLWELDLDGQFTWCSPETLRVMGIPADELLGKSILEIGLSEESRETLAARLEGNEPIEYLQLEAQDQSGRTLTLLMQALLRTDSTGRSLGYRGMLQVLEKTSPPDSSPWVVTLPTPPAEIDATSAPARAATWGTIQGYEASGDSVHPILQPINNGQEMEKLSRDSLTVPLRVGDQVIGVIELEEKADRSGWSEEDQALARAVAQELAVAFQDARSYQLTQQALVEMREADRLKSQFLANMSHELRTPLNSIIGFSRVILKGIDGPITESQEEDLNAIYNAGQHLLGLINNILDLSKIEAGKMELAFTDVDLREIIHGVMSTATGLVKDKPIELITDIPDDLPMVQADNIRIRQVLLNLVSNAGKYTEHGHIGVSARTIHRQGRSEIVIAVFDTGPGIAPADQERIFEPFSQVDASPTRKTGGTGLGLSISRHLVELHGGTIWVESIPGEGSTFAFTLPFDPGDSRTEPRTGRILLVDGAETHLDLYREALAGSDYALYSLDDPAQILDTAGEIKPSSVIIDTLNDSLSAFELIASLKCEPGLQASQILLADLDLNSATGMLLEVDDYLTLPLQPEALSESFEPYKREHGLRQVLAVSDQDSVLDAISNSLSDLPGLSIAKAADAPEAIVMLSRQTPDLILLDITLPGAGALDALAALEPELKERFIPCFGLLPEAFNDDDEQQLEDLVYQLNNRARRPIPQHMDKTRARLVARQQTFRSQSG
jgi:signal transduction histidine kinase/DNA-binding response OmpR family regulator